MTDAINFLVDAALIVGLSFLILVGLALIAGLAVNVYRNAKNGFWP